MLPRELTTARLRLRRWTDDDRAPFAAMNADARVMEHFPAVLGVDASNAAFDRIRAHFEANGFGLWAVEVQGGPHFVGFIGLQRPSFEPFVGAVEVGWRLAADAWGLGYAREGARAALSFAFDELRLGEVISMTATTNLRSMRVMDAIGMQRDPSADFEHPAVPVGHRVRPHVLYRIRAGA